MNEELTQSEEKGNNLQNITTRDYEAWNLLKLPDWHSLQFPFHLNVRLLHYRSKLLHRVHHEVLSVRIVFGVRKLLAKEKANRLINCTTSEYFFLAHRTV